MRDSKMIWLRWALPVAGVVVVAYFLAVVPERPQVRAAQGPAAPAFVLPDLDGRPVALESFRGHPVLVNFWATWCPPCRTELPDLQALSAEHEGCLAVIGVALGSGSADDVGRFARAHAVAYPVLMGNAQIAADYEVSSIPRSILVDAQGHEAAHWDGAVSREHVRAAVRALTPAPLSC